MNDHIISYPLSLCQKWGRLWIASSRISRSTGCAAGQQERRITDTDIWKQDYLFSQEIIAIPVDVTEKVQWHKYI
jgi:hypothetical protein